MDQSSHCSYMFLIYNCIPKHNCHFMFFWLSKSKNKSVIKVRPFIIRLNVRKQNWTINCKTHSKSKSFPTQWFYDSCLGWNSESSHMMSIRRIKLYTCLLISSFHHWSTNCQNVSIWIPFSLLNIHSSVNDYRLIVSFIFHQLNHSILICNT